MISMGGGTTKQLACYKDKIVIPKMLQKHVIDWYHTVLGHPGIIRTEKQYPNISGGPR